LLLCHVTTFSDPPRKKRSICEKRYTISKMSRNSTLFLLFVVTCLASSVLAGPTSKVRSKVSKKVGPVFVSPTKTEEQTFDTTRALIKTAKALARSHSTSEVLTLNLTNLLILIVLKAIIFGIGLFYFGGVSFKGGHHGGGGGDGWGRSLEEKKEAYMTQSELLLMLTYVLGSASENYECMYRVACEDPEKAKDYVSASKMLIKGAKYAKKYVSYNPKYEEIVRGLNEAVSHGKNHSNSEAQCRARYVCPDIPNL